MLLYNIAFGFFGAIIIVCLVMEIIHLKRKAKSQNDSKDGGSLYGDF